MSDIQLPTNSASSTMRAPSRTGDLVFGSLTRLAALVTLLLLGGILVSLVVASWPTLQKFGLSFIWTSDWDPPNDKYGGTDPDLRHADHFVHRAADRGAGQFRHCALPDRALAGVAASRPLGTAIELLAAIPSIVYGMWGLLVFARSARRPTSATAASGFRPVP
jgi:phosphate transport system permease protein